MSQLVVFEYWIELLSTPQCLYFTILLISWKEKKHTIKNTYFQDPAFVEADRQFLQNRGHTVLENGAAYGFMTSETFLFAPISGMSFLIQDHLQEAFPPLLISNEIEGLNGGAKHLRLRLEKKYM